MEYLPSDTDIVLGSGTYGKVYRVKGPDGNDYAVKVPTFDLDDPESVWIYEGFVTEGSTLSLLSGLDGIIRPQAISYYPPLIALDMYPMDGNSFGRYIIEELDRGAVSIGDIDNTEGLHPNIVNLLKSTYMKKKRFLYSCLVGLNNQFSRGIIHRDIKPGNMLGDRTGKFVIADYGLAENELYPGSNKSTNAYSEPFRPPEVFKGDELYDFSGDMWALGISYLFISTGRYIKDIGDIAKLVGLKDYVGYVKTQFLRRTRVKNQEYLDEMIDILTDYEKLNNLLSQFDIYNMNSLMISSNARRAYRQYLKEKWDSIDPDELEYFINTAMEVGSIYRRSLRSKMYDLETYRLGKLLTKEEAEILDLILRINPDDRPTPSELYEYAFFDDLRDSGDLPYPDNDLVTRGRIPYGKYRNGGRADFNYAVTTFNYYMKLDSNLDRSCLTWDPETYMADPLDYIVINGSYLSISSEIMINYLYMFSLLCIDSYTDLQLQAILFLASVMVSGESILPDDEPISVELYNSIDEMQQSLMLPRYMNITLLFNYRCNIALNRLPTDEEISELIVELSKGAHIKYGLLSIFNKVLGVSSLPGAAMK